MASTATWIASRISSLVMTTVLGRPVMRSRPLISDDSSLASGKALPISILSCSAVCVPTVTLCSLWMWAEIAWSMSSPAIRIDDLVTIPPKEITATSLVPPPMSTTMDPWASLTGNPAPMAAARGSSIVYACRAPADSVASLTALSSTPVTPLGTHTTTLGPESERRILLCGCALRMKYESIFSVTSKSAITPSFKGRIATMWPGVRPSILFAADPTATTLSVLLSMATTEGSERTIPCPLTNTSVFAVPRSIATSLPNSPPNIILTSPFRRYALAPHGLEHAVFFHTIVAIAHDNVVEHLYTQYPGGLLEPPGGFAILRTGLDLATGMIVHEHHARRTRPNGRLEDLPGMDEGGGKRAYTDQRGPYNLVFGV